MLKRSILIGFVFLAGCSFEEETHCPTRDEVMLAIKDLDHFKTTDNLTLKQAVERINNCQNLLDWNPKWSKDRACKAKVYEAVMQKGPQTGAYTFDLKALRQGISQVSEFFNYLFPAPGDAQFSIQNLGGTETVKVSSMDDHQNTVLYLHGGGYILNLAQGRGMFMQFAGNLSKAADAIVWMPDTPTAPEVRLSNILDSAYKSYLALLEQGVKPDNLFLVGDSAGGGLAMALLYKLRAENKPLPAGAILLSPWLDLALKGDFSTAMEDPLTDARMFKPLTETVLQGDNPEDPYISPLYGDLHDLCPILIITGEREGLVDDTRRFMKKAKTQEADVELLIGEKAYHDYAIFDTTEAALEAMHVIEDFTIEHAPIQDE